MSVKDSGAGRAEGLSIGWTVFGYLIGGMIAYGGIGWLIGRAVHIWMLFPVGMLVGLAISLAYIIYRFGKQGQGTGGMASPRERGAPGGRPPGSTPKEMTGDR
jgi:ATP synthase protein I